MINKWINKCFITFKIQSNDTNILNFWFCLLFVPFTFEVLDANISHQQAISILQQARGKVELITALCPSQPPSATTQVYTKTHSNQGIYTERET